MATSVIIVLVVTLFLSLVVGQQASFYKPTGDVWDYHPISKVPYVKGSIPTFYSYHIHTYFFQNNVNDTNDAVSLRNDFIELFKPVQCEGECDLECPQMCVWGVNHGPRGPHTLGSWGVYLPIPYFTSAVSYIMGRHGNLTNLFHLIHPNSGYPILDHTDYALWIGHIIPLDTSALEANIVNETHAH